MLPATCACGHKGKSQRPQYYQCGYCYYSACAAGNRKNAKECEAAHEHFTAMKAKGFLIFKVKPFGRKSKQQVERFDPKDGGYVYAEGKTENREPAEVAHKFDPKADYVATPMVSGG